MLEALALQVTEFKPDFANLDGLVSAVNVPDFARGRGFLFRKGDIISLTDQPGLAEKLKSLARSAPTDYLWHLIKMSPDEVSEDEAGVRLAQLVAGTGLERHSPVESRVNLFASQRGLLHIDEARLDQLNEVPGVAVFTLFNDIAVEVGTEVAGVKVTPLFFPVKLLDDVAAVTGGQPVIEVRPFQPWPVGVIVREHLQPGPRHRFQLAVEHKLAWFGAELLGVTVAENSADALEKALLNFKRRGARLILQVGGHSNDPLDPIFEVLPRLSITMERHGAPAHPGTLFWLAYWNETALFGLASCGMFSRTTLGDLFLARLLAGEHLTARSIAKVGLGGLFTREMAFRFPPYGLNLHEED